MRREYKNPPVNELVIGVYFVEPLLALRSEHIGIFWNGLKAEFPTIEQKPPIRTYIPAPGEEFPMPRYWFKSVADTYLIQVQRNAFLVNWRKRGEGDYPHFAAVKEAFDRHFTAFTMFVRDELKAEVAIELCELTYNNIVDAPSGNLAIDGPSIVPSFRLLVSGSQDATLSGFNVNNTYSIAKDLSLIIGLRSAARKDESKTPALVIEQRVTGKLEVAGKAAMDDWFRRAHDATGACFNSITSDRFRNDVWQLKDQI
jgi:uncharacterized protein (TIGR04255 family)